MSQKTSNIDVAMRAWGNPPQWIIKLAELCDQTSQANAARVIGYSGSLLNQVLQNKYQRKSKAPLQKIEAAVSGALMNQCVQCPVLGEISSRNCVEYQRQDFAATNSMRVQLYRACRNGCKHYKGQ